MRHNHSTPILVIRYILRAIPRIPRATCYWTTPISHRMSQRRVESMERNRGASVVARYASCIDPTHIFNISIIFPMTCHTTFANPCCCKSQGMCCILCVTVLNDTAAPVVGQGHEKQHIPHGKCPVAETRSTCYSIKNNGSRPFPIPSNSISTNVEETRQVLYAPLPLRKISNAVLLGGLDVSHGSLSGSPPRIQR